MKVKILQGIPASGKSTWAREYATKNKDWVIVSRDALRNMRGEYWIPNQENLITRWEQDAIKAALQAGKNVIVDATNLNKKHLLKLKQYILHNCGVASPKIETKFFHIDLEDAIKRDAKRTNGVGEKVIRDFWKRYIEKPVSKLIQDESLPRAIICDIDGTIAQMKDRSPFDWNRVDEDEPKKEIIKIVETYAKIGYQIIFFTGRDGNDICRNKTYAWLKENVDLFNYMLYMRAENDNRKDSIVKREMFDQYVRDKYCIDFWLDDRTQVVTMVRDELGLNCLQVDWGDF